MHVAVEGGVEDDGELAAVVDVLQCGNSGRSAGSDLCHVRVDAVLSIPGIAIGAQDIGAVLRHGVGAGLQVLQRVGVFEIGVHVVLEILQADGHGREGLIGIQLSRHSKRKRILQRVPSGSLAVRQVNGLGDGQAADGVGGGVQLHSELGGIVLVAPGAAVIGHIASIQLLQLIVGQSIRGGLVIAGAVIGNGSRRISEHKRIVGSRIGLNTGGIVTSIHQSRLRGAVHVSIERIAHLIGRLVIGQLGIQGDGVAALDIIHRSHQLLSRHGGAVLRGGPAGDGVAGNADGGNRSQIASSEAIHSIGSAGDGIHGIGSRRLRPESTVSSPGIAHGDLGVGSPGIGVRHLHGDGLGAHGCGGPIAGIGIGHSAQDIVALGPLDLAGNGGAVGDGLGHGVARALGQILHGIAVLAGNRIIGKLAERNIGLFSAVSVFHAERGSEAGGSLAGGKAGEGLFDHQIAQRSDRGGLFRLFGVGVHAGDGRGVGNAGTRVTSGYSGLHSQDRAFILFQRIRRDLPGNHAVGLGNRANIVARNSADIGQPGSGQIIRNRRFTRSIGRTVVGHSDLISDPASGQHGVRTGLGDQQIGLGHGVVVGNGHRCRCVSRDGHGLVSGVIRNRLRALGIGLSHRVGAGSQTVDIHALAAVASHGDGGGLYNLAIRVFDCERKGAGCVLSAIGHHLGDRQRGQRIFPNGVEGDILIHGNGLTGLIHRALAVRLGVPAQEIVAFPGGSAADREAVAHLDTGRRRHTGNSRRIGILIVIQIDIFGSLVDDHAVHVPVGAAALMAAIMVLDHIPEHFLGLGIKTGNRSLNSVVRRRGNDVIGDGLELRFQLLSGDSAQIIGGKVHMDLAGACDGARQHTRARRPTAGMLGRILGSQVSGSAVLIGDGAVVADKEPGTLAFLATGAAADIQFQFDFFILSGIEVNILFGSALSVLLSDNFIIARTQIVESMFTVGIGCGFALVFIISKNTKGTILPFVQRYGSAFNVLILVVFHIHFNGALVFVIAVAAMPRQRGGGQQAQGQDQGHQNGQYSSSRFCHCFVLLSYGKIEIHGSRAGLRRSGV